MRFTKYVSRIETFIVSSQFDDISLKLMNKILTCKPAFQQISVDLKIGRLTILGYQTYLKNLILYMQNDIFGI